jgi:hypothetical protein
MWGRYRNSRTKLFELRKWLPVCHSFAPPNVRWNETASTQTFTNFFFGKYAQTRCAPANVNHRHNPGVLVRLGGRVNARVIEQNLIERWRCTR